MGSDKIIESELEALRLKIFHDASSEWMQPEFEYSTPLDVPLSELHMMLIFYKDEQHFAVSPGFHVSEMTQNEFDSFCIAALVALDRRDELKASGEKHVISRKKVISDEYLGVLLTFLTRCLVERSENLKATQSFARLVSRVLPGQNSTLFRRSESERTKFRALHVGMMLHLLGRNPSLRNIALILGISHTTVYRSMENFEQQLAQVNSQWPFGLLRDKERAQQ